MKKLLLLSMLLVSGIAGASPGIYKATNDQPVNKIYEKLTSALESQRLFVVFEANIGRNLSNFKDKWAENYNRNQLSEIRSLVFCNAWYANEVSNLDPDMLALCPLKITLTEKSGKTTALFVLPASVAGDSPAAGVLKEVQGKVKAALEAAGFVAVSGKP